MKSYLIRAALLGFFVSSVSIATGDKRPGKYVQTEGISAAREIAAVREKLAELKTLIKTKYHE